MINYIELLKNASKETLELSIDQCHGDGIFSLVFAGVEYGNLTRAFIAKKGVKPFAIALHSHCYGLRLTAVKGAIRHHTAKPSNNGVLLEKHEYKSPLNGGNGLLSIGYETMLVEDFLIPIGGQIILKHNDVHTVSSDMGAIWIVEEMGFKSDTSHVYGRSFTTGNLYIKPSQYQVNDAVQMLYEALE